MTEQIQEFYDNIFKGLKEYILTNSQYNPYVFKKQPKDKLFPLVVAKATPRSLRYTTLKYTDALYYFGLDIDVYSLTKNGISGATVCKEISDIIERYFTEEYRMNVVITEDAPNIDESVDRTNIKIDCTLDTKYGDIFIIYSQYS